MKNYIFILWNIFIFSIILINKSFSQQKTIVPSSGAIVFNKEENIFDNNLFINSFKELMPKMKEEIFFERLTDGKQTDTIVLNSEIDTIEENFELMILSIFEEQKQKIKIYHEFSKDTITKYLTLNERIFNKNFIYLSLNETRNENNEIVYKKQNEIIKLTKYINETKEIEGYECFKIIYNYREFISEDFALIDSLWNNKTREMWVTEKIKCNYHPIVDEIEILEKYYPLEITEFNDKIKGIKTIFTLEKITIN